MTDPHLTYTFHLQAPNGNCLEPYATPIAFRTCKDVIYPDRSTAGQDLDFISPQFATDETTILALVHSQKGDCLAAKSGALSIAPCTSANDPMQAWALDFTNDGTMDHVTLKNAGLCLTAPDGLIATLSLCTPSAKDVEQSFSMKHVDSVCPAENGGGVVNLASLSALPQALNNKTLIWGDCLEHGMLLMSSGALPTGSTTSIASGGQAIASQLGPVSVRSAATGVPVATANVQPAALATDSADRVFWGDMGGLFYVYHPSSGGAEVIDQYGPLHDKAAQGLGRPHFLAYQPEGGGRAERLIWIDNGRMFQRDLSQRFGLTESYVVLMPSVIAADADHDWHRGLAAGVPVVDASGVLYTLGWHNPGGTGSAVWRNQQASDGEWTHRLVARLLPTSTEAKPCRDMTYNRDNGAFYALCTSGVWKVTPNDSQPTQILPVSAIGGTNPQRKAARVFGEDDVVMVFDESCRCAKVFEKSLGGYRRGSDLFFGLVNNTWQTAILAP